MNPVDKLRDDDRDAWLAQALRHAPDANADASPALSDTILREAWAAARPTAAPPRPELISSMQWLASAWDWLARPPVAAGFASLMVATLAGVMWWGRPLDETLPREPEVLASTPQARAESAPAGVAAPAPAEPSVEPRKPGGAAPTPAQQGAPTAMKDSAKKPSADAVRARVEATTAATASAAAAAPAAFPAAPPAAAPQAAAADNEAPAPLAQRRERAAPAAKAAAELSAQAAADTAAPLRGDLRAAQGSASPLLAKARAADTGNAALTELLASVTQQPERWRWQRGNGEPQRLTPDLQRWLAQFEQSTASRWRMAAEPAAREPASVLRLSRDGVLQTTLGFAGSGVWFETGGAFTPTASVAALPEGTAETLRQALDQATL